MVSRNPWVSRTMDARIAAQEQETNRMALEAYARQMDKYNKLYAKYTARFGKDAGITCPCCGSGCDDLTGACSNQACSMCTNSSDGSASSDCCPPPKQRPTAGTF